jgi:transposase
VEGLCARFYHARLGRPSLRPGIYFRALLVGYFEGIDSERGIAWRVADSLALRRFLLVGPDERTPDHSTISRTRRLIDIDTHREVFAWVLGLLAERGLLKGQRMGIDATTLEANAAMRSIVRRDSGETYEEFLRGLATASGIETPTGAAAAKTTEALELSERIREVLGHITFDMVEARRAAQDVHKLLSRLHGVGSDLHSAKY